MVATTPRTVIAPTDEPSAYLRRRLAVPLHRWIWRSAVSSAIAVVLGACGPIQQTGGEWALVRATSCEGSPRVDSAAALDLAGRRLREMDPTSSQHDFTAIRHEEPMLACGLRAAHHTASWSYHADGRDVWLLSFHEEGDLVALAAVDAATGTVLSITYSVWADGIEP